MAEYTVVVGSNPASFKRLLTAMKLNLTTFIHSGSDLNTMSRKFNFFVVKPLFAEFFEAISVPKCSTNKRVVPLSCCNVDI